MTAPVRPSSQRRRMLLVAVVGGLLAVATPSGATDEIDIGPAVAIDTSGLPDQRDLSIREISNDGSRIMLGGIAAGSGGQQILDVASGTTTDVPRNAVMASNGRFAVGDHPTSAGRFAVIDVDDGTTTPVDVSLPAGSAARPSGIADDGSVVSFTLVDVVTLDQSVIIVDLGTDDVETLRNPARAGWLHSAVHLSDDGRLVHYISRLDVVAPLEVWVWDRVTDEHDRLLGPDDFPTTQQAFDSSLGFEFIRFQVANGIHLLRLSTGTEFTVADVNIPCCDRETADDGTTVYTARSTDGSALLLWVWRPGHEPEIVSLGRENISRHGVARSAGLSGDGRMLYFVADDPTDAEPARLWARTIGGSEPAPGQLSQIATNAEAGERAIRLDLP